MLYVFLVEDVDVGMPCVSGFPWGEDDGILNCEDVCGWKCDDRHVELGSRCDIGAVMFVVVVGAHCVHLEGGGVLYGIRIGAM